MNEEIKPKKSWIKRHKVALIVTAIILVVIVAPLAGYFGFINAWNAGMWLPEGYKRYSYPLTESTKYVGYFIIHQFEEENPQVENRSKLYFKYNEELYRLQSDGSELFESMKEVNIYKDSDGTQCGTFFSQADGEYIWQWGYNRGLFLDTQYIYYMFSQAIKREAYFAHEKEWIYSKYTFYRLDLDTGNNEEVSIKEFVEKLNKYDETVKIK